MTLACHEMTVDIRKCLMFLHKTVSSAVGAHSIAADCQQDAAFLAGPCRWHGDTYAGQTGVVRNDEDEPINTKTRVTIDDD